MTKSAIEQHGMRQEPQNKANATTWNGSKSSFEY